ncbi:MAG: hypothetical protein VX265_01540 [Myxococcota bacterium]|nr:hypothetical protein [Myxococcota bacterium]
MRNLLLSSLCVAAAVTVPNTALANKGDHARYSAQLGVSPFGGAVNLGYNKNKRNTIVVAFGGAPMGSVSMEMEFNNKDFTVEGGTSWMGAFWNHRPIKDADWFRANVGFATGQITNELTEKGNKNNVYSAEWRNNPVGYVGVGFGNRVKEGFMIGFDVGALFTPGPQIRGPDSATVEAIEESIFFGPVLPNGQLTVGWGF